MTLGGVAIVISGEHQRWQGGAYLSQPSSLDGTGAEVGTVPLSMLELGGVAVAAEQLGGVAVSTDAGGHCCRGVAVIIASVATAAGHHHCWGWDDWCH